MKPGENTVTKLLFVLAALLLIAYEARAQRLQVTEWKTLTGHAKPVTSIAFTQDGAMLISGSEDGLVKLWSVERGRRIRDFVGHEREIKAVALSPDGKLVASASADNLVRFWATETGKKLEVLRGHRRDVTCVAFSQDGQMLASGAADRKIILWSVPEGKRLGTLTGHMRDVQSVAFSPDGKLLASGSADKKIKLWSTESFEETTTFENHAGGVNAVVFSPDGQTLASASDDDTVMLWSVSEKRALKTLDQHWGDVKSVAFSPNGKFLASGGSKDDHVKLWSVESGEELETKGHWNEIQCVAFSEDGQWLASASKNKTIRIWQVEGASVVPEPPDELGPVVEILEPSLARGFRVVSIEREVTVRGTANDPSGISRVMVNGVEATIDPDGGFSAVIEIGLGVNPITVEAVDRKNNLTARLFTIVHGENSISDSGLASFDGKYYALLIAVKDYDDTSVSDLQYPVEDAQRLMETLVANYTFNPENIFFLTNPDRATILRELHALKNRLTPDDNLLVFYSGHGHWDTDLEQGYWLPRDASADDTSAWVSNGTIRDYIRGIKTRHTLLVADACFSGGIFKTRSAFTNGDASVELTYSMPSRKAITSGALKTVPDRSVFLDYFVKNLERNQDKYLLSQRLYIDMKPAVINNSPLNQTPLYGTIQGAGDEGGDFIFIRR